LKSFFVSLSDSDMPQHNSYRYKQTLFLPINRERDNFPTTTHSMRTDHSTVETSS